MGKRSNDASYSGKDPYYVYTSRDGRKYIKPNEVVRLEEFKKSVKRLRKAVKNSKLVRGA